MFFFDAPAVADGYVAYALWPGIGTSEAAGSVDCSGQEKTIVDRMDVFSAFVESVSVSICIIIIIIIKAPALVFDPETEVVDCDFF